MPPNLLTIISAPAQVAGRLNYFQASWHHITDDPWVLETVITDGLQNRIPFNALSRRMASHFYVHDSSGQDDTPGCYFPVASKTPGGVVSSIFLVDKEVKSLNFFVDFQRCKMKRIHMLVKLDLTEAYFTVPVWKGHQNFLRFLSPLVASAPRKFTKIMKPVVATLRNLEIRLIYLDSLLMTDSEQGFTEKTWVLYST